LTKAPAGGAAHAFWFGEDQARYVVTVPAAQVQTVIERADGAGVPITRIGVTGSSMLALPEERPIPVATLQRQFESWLPAYMAAGV
jgi:phosphoribosylformylglycinamidine synthase